ncbi:MAG TPA: heparan-alpha-glucosaminide N-acetyltransferase domain-containing protein [Polyangiaceae bacterium]|jgi:uncharacterized membrane protein|nr:heparan-alpha-glucosaminide N-acetyltransferase domain-containing protein [Polyangiaceae bacterium]
MNAKAEAGATPASVRLGAIDVVRGLVIVLMAVDHSSGEFNRGRLMADGAFSWHPGTWLPAGQFLTRWMTHLCAPTFVFLAGTSLALSSARHAAKGESAASIDRHMALRGLFIIAAEIVPSLFWMPLGRALFQVLYAIGSSYLWMIPLRRLPSAVLVALAVAVLAGAEAFVSAMGWGRGPTPVLASLLLVPGAHGPVFIAYPTLGWLAIMVLGFVFGRWLTGRPPAARVRRFLFAAGAMLLALFLVVRGLNGYGNMGLLRESGALVQWLHVSKYPPSLTFAALELGIAAVLLGLAFAFDRPEAALPGRVLAVFGRTPMFFYLLHIPLLALTAKALGVQGTLGLKAAYGFAALAALALYPACVAYGRYRIAHPNGIARYV